MISDAEFESFKYEFINPDEWIGTDEDLMQSLGWLALMSGRLPSEIFEDPNWPKTILFNLRISNMVFKTLLSTLKLRS